MEQRGASGRLDTAYRAGPAEAPTSRCARCRSASRVSGTATALTRPIRRHRKEPPNASAPRPRSSPASIRPASRRRHRTERPTEVVAGAFRPRSQAACSSRWTPLRCGSNSSAPAGHDSPLSQLKPSAVRQGSRAARSPPGRRNGRQLATRSHAPGRPSRASPPHSVPSGPRPTPSQVKHSSGASPGYSPARPRHAPSGARRRAWAVPTRAPSACWESRDAHRARCAAARTPYSCCRSLSDLSEYLAATRTGEIADVRRDHGAIIPGQRHRGLRYNRRPRGWARERAPAE